MKVLIGKLSGKHHDALMWIAILTVIAPVMHARVVHAQAVHAQVVDAQVVNAQAGRYQCRSTSISEFADDPVYRVEKSLAIQSAKKFEVDTRTGVVKNAYGRAELWHVVEKGDGQADAVLMRQKNYKTLPIDEFISIIRWSDVSEDSFHFERSVLDGMVSGVCAKVG